MALPDPSPIGEALDESGGGWGAVCVLLGMIVGGALVAILEPWKPPASCESIWAVVPSMIAQCNETAWVGQVKSILSWSGPVVFFAGAGAVLGLLIYRQFGTPKRN